MLPTPSLDDAGARALCLIRHQLRGDLTALREQLDPASAQGGVDSHSVAEAWAEALQRVGELHAVEEPALRLGDDLSVVVEVSLHFARGDLRERVTFDPDGHVAAVTLLPEAPRG
jgi:hypothetical protein